MRFPRLSLEWVIAETGDMFLQDDDQTTPALDLITPYSEQVTFEDLDLDEQPTIDS